MARDIMRTTYTARNANIIDVYEDSNGDYVISFAGTEYGGLDIFLTPEALEGIVGTANSLLGLKAMESDYHAHDLAE